MATSIARRPRTLVGLCGVLFVVLATLLTSYVFRPGSVSLTGAPAVQG